MTAFFSIHPEKPQPRLIRQAAEILKTGVIVYPTDSYYALGCLQENVRAVEQIRRLRGLDQQHYLTLSCRSISQISDYANMDNTSFRLIKGHIPGPYTFILKAGKAVGRKLYHPSRRTVAFRVQAHPVAQALLAEINEAIITTTLTLAGDSAPLPYHALRERLKGKVDAVLDAGNCEEQPTTVLDFTETPPRLVREGSGEVETIDS